MIGPNPAHPSDEDLAAFAVGKLDDTRTDEVTAHLAKCDACRRVVENTLPDSFAVLINAAAAPEHFPPELADHPRYRIIRKLGQGGMGVVYLAQHKVMDDPRAIKVIARNFVDLPDAVARFHREVKAAAKLKHPNIAAAYDAEQVGNLHILVMEFVEGLSLDRVLARKGPLPVVFACDYIRQAVLGLQHAFEQGMVHRDIKSQNMMLTPKGQIKLLDFGLARIASETAGEVKRITGVGAYMGTPEYSSPEQATDARTADIRADIYSLGCTLFNLLTGRVPFQEETVVKMILAHISKPPPDLRELRPDAPAELSAVIAQMLAKNPAERFQTPADVARTLVPFCKPDAKPVAPPAAGPVHSPATRTIVPGDTSRSPSVATAAASPFAGIDEEPRTRRRPRHKSWLPGAIVLVIVLAAAISIGAAVYLFVIQPKDHPDTRQVAQATSVRDPASARAIPETKPFSTRSQTATESKKAPTTVKQNPSDFVPLFNGIDLTGWEPTTRNRGTWTVADGILEGKGVSSYLSTKRSDFANFHLRMELMKVDEGAKSVAVRSSIADLIRFGYRVSLDGTIGVQKNRLGSIIKDGVSVKNASPESDWELGAITSVSAGQWYTLEVIAQGNTISTRVNGTAVAEFVDRKQPIPSGQIMLFCLTTIRIRKIEIKELPGSSDPFSAGSIWSGTKTWTGSPPASFHLWITDRNAANFTGLTGATETGPKDEVSGTITDGRIRWSPKSVAANPAKRSYDGAITENQITGSFSDESKPGVKRGGTFTLTRTGGGK